METEQYNFPANEQSFPMRQEERKEVIASSPSLHLVTQSIEAGIIQPDPQYWWSRPAFNVAKYTELVHSLLPAYKQYLQRDAGPTTDESEDPPLIDTKQINWESLLKRTARDVIKRFYDENLVDRDLLVRASQFAGPGNIKVLDGNFGGYINIAKYLALLAKEDRLFVNEKTNTIGIPAPRSKAERDEYIYFGVKPSSPVALASDLPTILQEYDVDLPEEKSLELALHNTLGHEYAHAIDIAMSHASYAVALATPPHTLETLIRLGKTAHDEHFVRGIEEMYWPVALADIAEIPRSKAEQVAKNFYNRFNRLSPQNYKKIQAYYEELSSYGLTSEDVAHLEEALQPLHARLSEEQSLSNEDALLVQSINPVTTLAVQHKLAPYSPREIEQFVQNR